MARWVAVAVVDGLGVRPGGRRGVELIHQSGLDGPEPVGEIGYFLGLVFNNLLILVNDNVSALANPFLC